MERRKSDRRDVKLACRVASPALGGYRWHGTSENISRSGMLLSLEQNQLPVQWIEVGLPATVEVELPVEHTLGARCIHCEGRVVRVANEDEELQIAVRFSNMSFRDLRRAALSYVVSVEVPQKYLM